MHINVRHIGGLIYEVIVTIENATHRLGWLDETQATALAAHLRDAADSLNPMDN